MARITRRNVLGAAAVLAGGVLTAKARSASAEEKPAAAKTADGSIYKFKLGEAPARTYPDGSIREHKVRHFPIATTISAGLIRLGVGGIREPHWHPNSDEWLMVQSGEIRMTIVNGKGEAERFTCGPNDTAFIPQGFGHYVENVGDGECQILVVHNNGDFTTIELSEWVAAGSTSVFAATLNMPESAFESAPKKRVYMTKKKKKV